jgi:hypothetical protein
VDEHCPGIFPKARPGVAAAHAFMQDMFEAFLVQAEESIDTAEARGRFRIHPHFDVAAERKRLGQLPR